MRVPQRGARRLRAASVVAAALLLAGCAAAKPIKTLLDDPGRYDGQTVRIAGKVTESIGVLGVGGYQVDDGTGALVVVLQSGAPPRVGAEVGVQGTFRAGLTVGGLTVAALVEKDRRVK